jgi:putative addiction module antidote
MKGIKLRRVGNSIGLILPKEILVKLKLEKGDTVFLSDTPSGIAISPYDPTFQ